MICSLHAQNYRTGLCTAYVVCVRHMFTAYVVCVYGICLRHMWSVYGICLWHMWSVYGICLRHMWSVYGICLWHMWSVYGICVRHMWSVYGICLRHMCSVYGICVRTRPCSTYVLACVRHIYIYMCTPWSVYGIYICVYALVCVRHMCTFWYVYALARISICARTELTPWTRQITHERPSHQITQQTVHVNTTITGTMVTIGTEYIIDECVILGKQGSNNARVW